MLVDKSVRELLTALASSAPTPAGGSASALASAAGVSLLMMAASLVKSRTGSVDEREVLSGAWRVLAPLQEALIRAVDRDYTAYGQVASARQLSRSVPRDSADPSIELAMRGATEVPLEVMRASSQALREAVAVAGRCYRPASSDVRVAIGLIRAGLAGARSSAEANLPMLTDRAYVEAVRAEIDQLSLNAARAVDAAENSLVSQA